MKYINYILLVLLAFLLVVLDTSFFSFLPVYGATILSSYIAMTLLAVVGKWPTLVAIVFATILALALLTSLPMLLIFIVFFVVPFAIYYLRKNYFSEFNLGVSAIFFCAANIIFALLLIIYGGYWGERGLLAGAYFIVIHTLIEMLLLLAFFRLRKIFTREEIKI
jgi:hypothetical protein